MKPKLGAQALVANVTMLKRQILGDSNLIYFWFLSRIKRVVWIMTLVLYLGLDQPRPRLTRGWGCWVPSLPWSTQWCLVRSAVWCWLAAYVISSMHFYIPCLKRLFEWLQCNIFNNDITWQEIMICNTSGLKGHHEIMICNTSGLKGHHDDIDKQCYLRR